MTKDDLTEKIYEIKRLVNQLDEGNEDHQALMYKLDSALDRIVRFIEFEKSWYA